MKEKEPTTLAAHLEGELKQEDVDYIMSLIDRFKTKINKGIGFNVTLRTITC